MINHSLSTGQKQNKRNRREKQSAGAVYSHTDYKDNLSKRFSSQNLGSCMRVQGSLITPSCDGRITPGLDYCKICYLLRLPLTKNLCGDSLCRGLYNSSALKRNVIQSFVSQYERPGPQLRVQRMN